MTSSLPSLDARAVVSDDNHTITLTVYAQHAATALVELELEPLVALRLAADLLHAATRHTHRPAPLPSDPRQLELDLTSSERDCTSLRDRPNATARACETVRHNLGCIPP